jgi:3',5'-cyclic-AMP phosphodiesterase
MEALWLRHGSQRAHPSNHAKVEGNITFHAAMSTALPQPKPGEAKSAGPMKVPEEQLRSTLGLTSVLYVQGRDTLALVDSTLA